MTQTKKIFDKKCCIDTCKNRIRSARCLYCEKHYYRIRRTGTSEDKKRKYSVNNNYFDHLTKDKAWLLGIIWSDGNLRGNRIHISSKDKDMLDKIEEMTEGKNCISKYTSSDNAFYYAVSSKRMSVMVKKYGLIETKSLTVEWPKIPKNLEWDFLRGVFDGDGYVSIKKSKKGSIFCRTGMVTASLSFFKSICDFLDKNDISYHKREVLPVEEWHHMTYRIDIVKRDSLEQIYCHFYNKKNSPCLKRKYDNFKIWHDAPLVSSGCPKKDEADLVENIEKEKLENIKEEVIDKYLNVYKTLPKTSSHFGVSIISMSNFLKSNSINLYPTNSKYLRMNVEDKKIIAEDMRQNKLNFSDIREKYGIKRGVLRKILREDN